MRSDHDLTLERWGVCSTGWMFISPRHHVPRNQPRKDHAVVPRCVCSLEGQFAQWETSWKEICICIIQIYDPYVQHISTQCESCITCLTYLHMWFKEIINDSGRLQTLENSRAETWDKSQTTSAGDWLIHCLLPRLSIGCTIFFCI